ncbi:MAG: G/U mismatch-specific DNA glycosylase [Cyanobacteria bacterium P01_D01_bin.6]
MPLKPTKAELKAAYGATVPDIIAPHLKILFCGINPSVYSAVVGHHFARPGNRLWKTLYAAGFTDRLLEPKEDRQLLNYGYGMTNIAEPATARADELSKADLLSGYKTLAVKVKRNCPRVLAVLGISAYRSAFVQPKATLGLQPNELHNAKLWVLPNPSGLNAHYQLPDLARVYRELFDYLAIEMQL